MHRYLAIAFSVLGLAYGEGLAQGFVNLDYRAYDYQPGGYKYYQTYYRVGTDNMAGEFRTRSFFEFNANTTYDAALNRVEMQFSGWKLFGGKWDASLGDMTLASLSPTQSGVPLRGIRLISTWHERIATETFWGRAPDRYRKGNFPLFNNNDQIIAQGIKAVISKRLLLRSRISYRIDKVPDQYASYLPVHRIFDWTSRAEWSLLSNLRSQHHVSLGNSRSFERNGHTDVSGGSYWEYFSRDLRASADYQYKGPYYTGMNNDGSGCRENLLAFSSSWTLLKKVTLSSSFNQKWASPPVDSLLPRSQQQRWGAGLRTAIPKWPVFQYRLDRHVWEFQRGSSSLYDMLQWTNNFELQYNWRLLLWRLNYQLQDNRDQVHQKNRLWHQWSLNGNLRFGAYTLNLEERVNRYNDPRFTQWTQGFGFGQRWGKLLNTSMNISWGQGNSVSGRWKTENLGWNIKAETDRSRGWNVKFDMDQNHYFYSDIGPAMRNTSWGFKLERNFRGVGELVSLGQIRGRVYEDANGNMAYDNGDKGIPDIPIMIDGKPAGRTDKKGEYRILGIAAGSHAVKLDVSRLDASMDPSIGGKRRFTTVGVWGPTVDFPLAPLNEIYGDVFLDDNRNGVRDEEESGLPGVFVLMGDNRRFTASDDQGGFIFHNVQPGRYRVFIDPRFLPDTLSVTGEPQFFVNVENQNDVGGLAFGINKKVRPIRKVVFASSQVTEAERKPVPIKPAGTRGSQPAKQTPNPPPEEIRRLYDLGTRQYTSGDYKGALATWDQLLKLDPGNSDAIRNRDRTKAKMDALQKIKGE